MNFQKLSDESLDIEMVTSVKTETEATLRVLHLLREVDRRRLFSKLKYKSLLDYAERRLGYPYDQAWRRIQAMRLLKEMPEIEAKIVDGSLNLTNLGYAQAAFKAESRNETPLSKEEKLQFLERIENKSTRATQKLVAEEFGKEALIRETLKPVSAEISMLSIPVNDELLAKSEKLKGLLAHSHPGISTADLIALAFDQLIEKVEKAKQSRVAAPRKSKQNMAAGSRHIPASENRKIWSESQKCFNCGSTYALERDHIIPFAKEGATEASNLRLLCRSCNQRHAISTYGLSKMSRFLKAPIRRYSA